MTTTTDENVSAIDADKPTIELVRRLAVARKAIASWKDEEQHVRELLIKTFAADHPGVWQATLEARPVLTIAVRPTQRFDQTGFKEDHPDLYERYRTMSEVVTVNVQGRVLDHGR